MPTDDNASGRPTNISTARGALLTALRKDSSLPVAARSSRLSMADEIHKVINSATPAVRAPCSSVRTDNTEPPTFHLILSTSSSSSSMMGSRPLTHITNSAQASQEKCAPTPAPPARL